MILGEALLLGTIGTILGLALGIIMGRAVVGLIAQTISDLYFSVTVERVTVAPITLLTGGGIGLLASIIAAVVPSWEATRIAPAGAMRRSEVEQNARRVTPIMTAGALLLTLGGVLVLGGLAEAAKRCNPDEGLQTLEIHWLSDLWWAYRAA